MITLPDYWLQCPDGAITTEEQAAFEALYASTAGQEACVTLDYDLAAPKWRFLNYLVETHDLLMHGSGNRDIRLFEPRKADDISEFGNQKAVYAAADGVWAMFFAIVDRDTYPMGVSNACIQFVENDAPISDSFYLFSISRGMLPKKPWRTGVVYLLPPETFAEHPTVPFKEYTARVKQQASPVPVKPIAKIEVVPEDFPFLTEIREHDDSRMAEYATAMQTGAAWPD